MIIVVPLFVGIETVFYRLKFHCKQACNDRMLGNPKTSTVKIAALC